MKRILSLLFGVLCISHLAVAQEMTPVYQSDKIDNETIYFFTKDMCPYCNHAATYIATNYPQLHVEFKDITTEENMELMIACADKFKLNKRQLGTPLICMGQHYILGWSESEAKNFDSYVKDFLPAQ